MNATDIPAEVLSPIIHRYRGSGKVTKVVCVTYDDMHQNF